jgi:hypothetical protein
VRDPELVYFLNGPLVGQLYFEPLTVERVTYAVVVSPLHGGGVAAPVPDGFFKADFVYEIRPVPDDKHGMAWLSEDAGTFRLFNPRAGRYAILASARGWSDPMSGTLSPAAIIASEGLRTSGRERL